MKDVETPALEVIRAAPRAAVMLQSTRRELLAALGEPASAATLARKLGLPRQRVNYHLRELEREGLVTCVEERRKGNCTERIMRMTAKSFAISPEALGVLGPTPETARDRLSATYLIATAAQTMRDVAALDARARNEGKRLSTFTIDAEIRFAGAAARARFADELASAITDIVARHHEEGAPAGRRFRLVAMVHPSAPPPDNEAPTRETRTTRQGRKPPRSKHIAAVR